MSKLKRNLVLVTDQLLKDLPRKNIQYYSGDSVVIFRRLQKGNTEVRDGIIFASGALSNRVIIEPHTKGTLIDSEENKTITISFVKNNDTLTVFKPDSTILKKEVEYGYSLSTDLNGTVKFNENVFKLITPGTFLYADKRTIPIKKITHIFTGSSVTKKSKKRKNIE